MKLVLDAGALIALERDDRVAWRLVKEARVTGGRVVTHGGVIGQAWRKGGARQALLARALAAVEVLPLDDGLGRRAGRLLADARLADVIDAALVLLADEHDVIVTSDPDDLEPLATALGREIEVVVV